MSEMIVPVQGWQEMDEDALEEAYGETAWWSVAKALERHRPDDDAGNREGYAMWLACVTGAGFGFCMYADDHGWQGTAEALRLFERCSGYDERPPWMNGWVPA